MSTGKANWIECKVTVKVMVYRVEYDRQAFNVDLKDELRAAATKAMNIHGNNACAYVGNTDVIDLIGVTPLNWELDT